MKTTMRTAIMAVLAGSLLSAPVAFADNFNALPLKGKASFDAWPHYFWSYFGGSGGISGGLAYRFADNVSPAEQFDKGFGNAAKLAAALPKIQAFGECALKAKQSCMPVAGASHRMNQECLKKATIRAAHAACKRDFAMDTVTAHEVVHQGVGKLDADFWWGVCHGWSAAAVLFREPVKNVVHNGVTFRPGDIKAYMTIAATDVDLAPGGWIGSRYDGPSSGAAALADVSPAQYHGAMGKFLGQGRGLVVDRHTGAEVWNQPVDRFETVCTPGGAGCAAGEQAQTCRTAFTWAEDNSPSVVDAGRRESNSYTTRNLNYTGQKNQ